MLLIQLLLSLHRFISNSHSWVKIFNTILLLICWSDLKTCFSNYHTISRSRCGYIRSLAGQTEKSSNWNILFLTAMHGISVSFSSFISSVSSPLPLLSQVHGTIYLSFTPGNQPSSLMFLSMFFPCCEEGFQSGIPKRRFYLSLWVYVGFPLRATLGVPSSPSWVSRSVSLSLWLLVAFFLLTCWGEVSCISWL